MGFPAGRRALWGRAGGGVGGVGVGLIDREDLLLVYAMCGSLRVPDAVCPASGPTATLTGYDGIQKCKPTVKSTAWLMKWYVPSANRSTVGTGCDGGVLPVTVWSGPYPS